MDKWLIECYKCAYYFLCFLWCTFVIGKGASTNQNKAGVVYIYINQYIIIYLYNLVIYVDDSLNTNNGMSQASWGEFCIHGCSLKVPYLTELSLRCESGNIEIVKMIVCGITLLFNSSISFASVITW